MVARDPAGAMCTMCQKPIRPTQVKIRLRDGRETHVACAILHGEWRTSGSAAAPPKEGAA